MSTRHRSMVGSASRAPVPFPSGGNRRRPPEPGGNL